MYFVPLLFPARLPLPFICSCRDQYISSFLLSVGPAPPFSSPAISRPSILSLFGSVLRHPVFTAHSAAAVILRRIGVETRRPGSSSSTFHLHFIYTLSAAFAVKHGRKTQSRPRKPKKGGEQDNKGNIPHLYVRINQSCGQRRHIVVDNRVDRRLFSVFALQFSSPESGRSWLAINCAISRLTSSHSFPFFSLGATKSHTAGFASSTRRNC